jgi:prephenate dehydrogenase
MTESRRLPMVSDRAPAAPPIFERIAVLGLGLIGGSIALAARQRWPRGLVIGVDTNDVLEQAMTMHAVDVGADDPVIAAEADLVILAAPVGENIKLLESLPEQITGTAVVTDTGSTKLSIVEAARHFPERLTFIGGHPLGGAARGGIEHARADLFRGRPWLLTPDEAYDGRASALTRLEEFTRELGADPHVMDARHHDHIIAFISQLPQLAATALMATVGEAAGTPGLALAGRGLVDTTRLASSPSTIWRDICATNGVEIGRALDELIAVLMSIRQSLDQGSEIDDIFQQANRWRSELIKNFDK